MFTCDGRQTEIPGLTTCRGQSRVNTVINAACHTAGSCAQQKLFFGSKLNRNGVQRTIVNVGVDSETLNWF
jgi:hypothetical protein